MKIKTLRYALLALSLLILQAGCAGGGIDGTGLPRALSVQGRFLNVDVTTSTMIRVETGFSDEERIVTEEQPFEAEILWQEDSDIFVEVTQGTTVTDLVISDIPSNAIGLVFTLENQEAGFAFAEINFLLEE